MQEQSTSTMNILGLVCISEWGYVPDLKIYNFLPMDIAHHFILNGRWYSILFHVSVYVLFQNFLGKMLI